MEVAIKVSTGKLRIPGGFALAVDRAGFAAVDFPFEAAELLRTLPWHHRDPFDRLLIVHALWEGVPIVTRDPHIQKYSI